MKLTLEQKVARNMALNTSELVRATGWSRVAIKRMQVPLIERKITINDFERHVARLIRATHVTIAPSSDLRSVVDKLRELAPSYAPPGALQRLVEDQPHNTESQTSPS